MTSQKLVARKKLGKLEAHAAEIIAMALDGKSQRDIAAKFDGTLRGVQLLLDRHDVMIRQAKAEAVEIVRQSYLSDKQRRVEELQWWYEQARNEAEQYGVVTEQILIAEDGGPITTRKYRHELSKEARATLKDIAVEEGQIVPAAPNKGGMVREVIIREYEGAEQYL